MLCGHSLARELAAKLRCRCMDKHMVLTIAEQVAALSCRAGYSIPGPLIFVTFVLGLLLTSVS